MQRRRRRVSRLELFYAMVITGLMVGGSLWLDRNGVAVTGRVAAKQERIVVGHEPSGEWRRLHEVAVAFELPDGGGSQATVRVPPARYDALRAGDPIELRYLPQFPLLARTTDRSTASVASELAWGLAGIPIVMWVAGGFLALWVAARMGTIPVLVAGAAWLAAGYTLLLTPPSRVRPRPARAMAQVRGVTLVDKSPERVYHTRRWTSGFNRRLEVPYQVVELLIPARGGRDTVLAVDAVDSGSVAGLAHGVLLPVRLDPAAPRDAQLTGGTRRFVEANRYHFLVPVIGCGILGTLAALAYRWRRRKRQTTVPTLREGQMEVRMPALCLTFALLFAPTSEWRLVAQARAPADGIHACDLVSSADVEKVTGRPAQKPPSRLSELQSTQSYCGFRDAAVRVTLLSKLPAAQKHVYQELEVGGFDKVKHAVPGVGDSATIYYTAKGQEPGAFLVTYAGTRTLTIGVQGDQGRPSESARPFAVGLAKIALAKLD